MLEGKPTVLSGAYVSESEREAVQRDVQVLNTTHPLARGFDAGQVVAFETEQDYVVDVLDEYEDEETIIMARGPASEAGGTASVVAIDDDLSGMRVVIVGFPIYLLPDEARVTLVSNIAAWALAP